MSDASEKPFEPTPQRIARAKREGNAARAGELAANASFSAAALCVGLTVPGVAGASAAAITGAAESRANVPAWAAIVAFALAPIAAAALAGTLAAALQSGGLRFSPVTLKFERCNPGSGFKRLCSRETLAHAARAGLAFAVASTAMLPFLGTGAWPAVVGTPWPGIAAAAWRGCEGIAGVAVAVGTAFAIAEFASARRVWLRTLRMSLDERRREARDQEGDPHARGRRRAMHRSLARGAIARVKDAAFVVVNPTHVAIALDYRPPEVPVPCVLVRATDEAALRVREAAEEHRIPIVEDAALARALHRDARAGDPIPQKHYIAVAEVVASLARAGAV